MKILIVGDVVGKGGRRAVSKLLPGLRKDYGCCFCITNGENAAGGAGLTGRCVEELKQAGVDVITSGDHIWDRKEFIHQIAKYPFVLRPANFDSRQPGAGFRIFNIPIGGEVCVISLAGRIFMNHHGNNPFTVVDDILNEIQGQTKTIFVDFHAEATSEKIAMGRHLDGRVTGVFGTHTHVQTADERILPGGTAYISDVGMVGGRNSILGRNIEAVVKAFSTGLPNKFTVVEDGIELNGAIIEFEPEDGKATAIERISRSLNDQ